MLLRRSSVAVLEVVLALSACGTTTGSSPAASPVASPNTPATAAIPAPAPAPADAPESAAPSAAAPAPSAEAPPTPPRVYQGAACEARVATFRDRLRAVVAHADHVLEATQGAFPLDAADADLTTPSVIVEVRDSRDRFCAEFGGQWGLTLHAGGRRVRFDGRDKIARVVRAVGKHLQPGDRIGVRLDSGREMAPLAPLLVELSRLAPLQLPVPVAGPAYALPTQDAPAWALERVAAFPLLPQSMAEPRRTTAIRASIHAASSGCAHIRSALDDSTRSPGASIAHEIARLVPTAVSRCACADLDVDALELFLVWSLGGDLVTVSSGWLEARFVDESDTRVPVWTWPSALHDLAERSRDERVGGLQLGAAAIVTTARGLADRCE